MKKYLFASLFLVLLSGCVFLRPSPEKQFARAQKKAPFDAAIVPGCPYDGNDWTRAMKGRVIWAAYLYKKGIVRNLIFSGGAVYSPYVEARVMALYAEKLGVPKENIFLEEKAEHTTENVYYSYHLAKQLGFEKLAIATDPFQYRMIAGFAKRRFRKPIAHIPFVVDSLATVDNVYPKIDAAPAKVDSFRSIEESQSFWKRFMGTSGLGLPLRND